MPVQDPIKFGDVVLLIGDGEGTEGFDAVCGFTSMNWQTTTNETSEDLPDCDDVDGTSYSSPIVTAVGDQVQCQGYVDANNSTLMYEWVAGGEEVNIRIFYSKGTNDTGGKSGWYEGPAVATNREEAYERRLSGKINVTIKFRRKPVWSPYPPPPVGGDGSLDFSNPDNSGWA